MTYSSVAPPWHQTSNVLNICCLYHSFSVHYTLSSSPRLHCVGMSVSSKDEGGGVAPQNKGSWSSFLKVRYSGALKQQVNH